MSIIWKNPVLNFCLIKQGRDYVDGFSGSSNAIKVHKTYFPTTIQYDKKERVIIT